MSEVKNGYIGIDLGTTNSCIATSYYTSNGAVQTEVLKISQRCKSGIKKEEILPSYIYIQKNGEQIIGLGAKELDDDTRRMTGGAENRALRVFKRDMGRDNVSYKIDNFQFTPVKASALVLEECGKAYNTFRKNRDALKFSDTPATITCPACFEKDAKEDTQTAAKFAGFDLSSVRMLAEPNAALLSYVYNETQRGYLDLSTTKRFVTVDLGGGTCDIVIIDVKEELLPSGKKNLVFRPIGTPNRGDLGGSDFDRAIARAFLIYFLNENNIKIDSKSKEYEQLVNVLFAWAEKAKEALSKNLSYEVENDEDERDVSDKEFIQDTIRNLEPIPIHIDNLYRNLPFDYDLTLEEYLQIVDGLIFKKIEKYDTIEAKLANKNLEEILFDTMNDCGCKKEDIDYVFFTGGMSLFIPLQLDLYEMLGKEIKTTDHPLTAVAEGAALYTLFKEAEHYNNIVLPQITNEDYHLTATDAEKAVRDNNQQVNMPTSIGKTYMIEKKDMLPFVLIEKNAEYPIPRTRIDSTFWTNSENGVIINIFFGSSQYNSDIEKARSLELYFEQPKQIETAFKIDYEINDSGSPIFYIVFSDDEEYRIGGVENE